MLFMDYPSIREEYFPDYAKKAAWKLLNAYIDAHSQSLIDEYPENGGQAISILQSKWASMTFVEQSRYNKLYQQVIHKGGESAINYIKIFHNAKALVISERTSYYEDQLMYNFLDHLHQGG